MTVLHIFDMRQRSSTHFLAVLFTEKSFHLEEFRLATLAGFSTFATVIFHTLDTAVNAILFQFRIIEA